MAKVQPPVKNVFYKPVYLDFIEEYNIDVNDLPEDAVGGISDLESTMQSFYMIAKNGHKPSEAVLKKCARLDGWIVKEIKDYLYDKNQAGDRPDDTDDIVDEVEYELEDGNGSKKFEKGDKIDTEILALIKAGKQELTSEEIKSGAPTAYAVLFENYKDGEENGLETALVKVVEHKEKKQTFILSLK